MIKNTRVSYCIRDSSILKDDGVPFDEFHVTEIEGAMQKLLVSLLGHCQGTGT